MPNWCDNFAEFRHEDPTQVQRVLAAYKAGKLFGEFAPCPPELLEHDAPARGGDERAAQFIDKYGAKDWYDWCVSNWGTKWDIGEQEWDLGDLEPDSTMVGISFQTAWAPPVEFYRTMTDDFGFDITAYYLEEGMSFAGKYTSEHDDDAHEFSDREDLANIPEDIREHWDLDSIMDSREEWDAENAEPEEDTDSEEPQG